VKSLEFDPSAFEDLAWWVEKDRKKALRIIELVREIQRDPFRGSGQPEMLKHELGPAWRRLL
jgi:toxin YoeB